MTLTVQAVYENGTLKLTEPLPLREHESVTVTIFGKTTLARQSAGMVPWTGDAETLERLIRDPSFTILRTISSTAQVAPVCSNALSLRKFVALMQQNGVTKLASEDGDFDRVVGVTRYAAN
jgi:predicted DNA-binding antitoxin AbrB/MazE fold protein